MDEDTKSIDAQVAAQFGDSGSTDMREIGATGLKRLGGFIYEEFLPVLTGSRGVMVYKEMGDNDPTVGAMLSAIQLLCRQVKWRVDNASEQPFDVEASEFLETCMEDMDMTWHDVINEALSMLQYGFSIHEIVYKRRAGPGKDPMFRSKHKDGRIGWRKISIRSQDTVWRWHFDNNGAILGFDQLAPPLYRNTTIPIEKCLLFRTSVTKNNPEGRSVLRSAYRPWYMKKNIENIEAIGVERDLAGLPVALVPPEIMSGAATAQQKQIFNEIKKIVTNIRRDEQEGVVFPQIFDENGRPKYELKLLSTGGQRAFDTDKIINRYDKRIAMTALADFILMGQEAVGSFALSTTKTNMFFTAIGAYLQLICDVFNQYAIPRLFELNPDIKVSEYPKLCHGGLESIDLKELGTYLQQLAAAGMPLFPDPELENHLRKIANLPERQTLETIDQNMHVDQGAKPGQQVEGVPGQPKLPGQATPNVFGGKTTQPAQPAAPQPAQQPPQAAGNKIPAEDPNKKET